MSKVTPHCNLKDKSQSDLSTSPEHDVKGMLCDLRYCLVGSTLLALSHLTCFCLSLKYFGAPVQRLCGDNNDA